MNEKRLNVKKIFRNYFGSTILVPNYERIVRGADTMTSAWNEEGRSVFPHL